MRRLLLCFLGLFALLLIAPAAMAQQGVFHCIGAHGEPVYSGQPCGTPAPPPGTSADAGAVGRFGGVCAASPAALRQDIAEAFATRDVNRLAGLILWRGMGSSDARATLRTLADWLQQPLTGIASAYAAGPPYRDDAQVSPAAAASVAMSATRAPTAFQISTGGGDGRTREFGVTSFGGCWWLTF